MKELPQLEPPKDCNRCGECCRVGGACLLRPMAGLPAAYNGRCDILRDNADGTTHCYLIEHCLNTPVLEMWASQYQLDGTCEWPEHRKEINASVRTE